MNRILISSLIIFIIVINNVLIACSIDTVSKDEKKLHKRICMLLKRDIGLSCEENIKIKKVYHYMANTEYLNSLLINDSIIMDSLFPSYIEIRKQFSKERYLKVDVYVLNSDDKLIATGDLHRLYKSNKTLQDDYKDSKKLIFSKKTERILVIGNNGLYTIGYCVIVRENGYFFYNCKGGDFVQISVQEYVENVLN